MIRAQVADAIYAEAVRLTEAGEADGAVALLATLGFFFPGNLNVRHALGAAHHGSGRKQLALGRIEEAIVSFNRALALNSGLSAAHDDLARLLRTSGDLAARTILVEGGVGDFLQCLPFLESCSGCPPQIVVLTHFKPAHAFFERLGFHAAEIHQFSDLNELRALTASMGSRERLSRCPRSRYFDEMPFEPKSISFPRARPVLGVHLGGSTFSIGVQKQMGVVTKELPPALLHELLSDDSLNIILFGSPPEIESLGIKESDSLKWACLPDIVDSLSLARQCNAFVGSDSVVKTMTAMLKIPTVVWIGDYPDPTRDGAFIDPYVRDRVMQVYRFKDLASGFEEGVRFTRQVLSDFGVSARA
jgi:hypothetical protein